MKLKLHSGDICKQGYKTKTVFIYLAVIGFIGTLITRAWFHGFPPKEHSPQWVALFFSVIIFTILFLKGLIGHFVYLYIHKEECERNSKNNISHK
jgi:fatty acid desaturase